jgi:hypothetical protein
VLASDVDNDGCGGFGVDGMDNLGLEAHKIVHLEVELFIPGCHTHSASETLDSYDRVGRMRRQHRSGAKREHRDGDCPELVESPLQASMFGVVDKPEQFCSG